MLFTELRFLFFFLLVFAVHWSLPGNRQRKVWLLLCSYWFYAAWDWRFLLLMWVSTLLDYWVGLLLGSATRPSTRKRILLASIVGNLGLLGFFKYYNFFVESAADLLRWFGFSAHAPTLELILPVGISFYTFQTLSYTIEIYRGTLKPTRNLLDFALFLAFFTHLVAGPILRAADFLPQLVEKTRWRDVKVRPLLSLFLIGFVKKACVSDNVAVLSDQLFANPQAYTVLERWLGISLYSIQAYCDFSGYTDMAFATAGLLGYELVINFNFPFFAVSVTDLWRRWHISLMSWLRDYVYIPLGGNRRGTLRTGFNMMTVFLLCGLWHGANWNYLCWGLFNGLILMAERAANRRGAFDPLQPGLHRRLYTHLVWMLGLVMFRAGTMPNAATYLAGLFWPIPITEGATISVDPRWWLVVPAFGIVHWIMFKGHFRKLVSGLSDPAYALAYGAAVALVLPFVATEYQPFIYFQF